MTAGVKHVARFQSQRREKQNRTKSGNVRKRGQEMGWFRDTERKERSVKAEDKKGKNGNAEKIKRWSQKKLYEDENDAAFRGQKRRNPEPRVWLDRIQVIGKQCPFDTIFHPSCQQPICSFLHPTRPNTAWLSSRLAPKRYRNSAKLLCGQSCQVLSY